MPERRVVIDHLTLGVSSLAKSREFYARVLAPLGFVESGPWREGVREATFGVSEANDFAISEEYPVSAPLHVAFAAEEREQVDAFHAAALVAGATDNGAPGPRPEYSARYYGAFVLDPDGYNIEAVYYFDR